jgi:hypothetical protein
MQHCPYVYLPTLYRCWSALTTLVQRAQHRFGPLLIAITVGVTALIMVWTNLRVRITATASCVVLTWLHIVNCSAMWKLLSELFRSVT